jgi:hypothetical protein
MQDDELKAIARRVVEIHGLIALRPPPVWKIALEKAAVLLQF